jgi:hypothetical protein
MAANINDKLTAVMNGGQPVVTTVSSPRSAGVTTLSCVALTYWPTATKAHFITYRKTAAGAVDRSTQQNWMGIVSGNTVTGLVKTDDAADAGNSAGDFVEMTPTPQYGQDLYDGLAASHDNDGTLKAGAVDVAAVLASNVVETAKIKDANVTMPKISNPYGFLAIETNAMSIGGGTTIIFNSETYDSGSNYNVATGVFTAPVSGYYTFSSSFTIAAMSAQVCWGEWYKNAAVLMRFNRFDTVSGSWSPSASIDVYLAANNTFAVRGVLVGTARKLEANQSYFSGHLVRIS